MLGLSRRLLAGIARRVPTRVTTTRMSWHGLRIVVPMLLVCVGSILQGTVRQIHAVNCPYNYYHTGGPLMFNADAFEAASRIKTVVAFKQSGFVDGWMNWVPTTALTDFTPDTTYYLEKLQGRDLGYIYTSWDSRLGIFVAHLYPRDVLQSNWTLKPDSAANWTYENGAQVWIRCRPSWRPDSNRATVVFLNERMIHHLRPWLPATMSAAAVTADMDRHLEYHNTHLGQFLIDRLKVWLGLAGIVLAFLYHLWAVRAVRPDFDRLRQQFRGDEFRLPRMSWWRLIVAWNIGHAWESYKARLDAQRRARKLEIRMQGREKLVEDVVFDLATRTLPDFERQLNGQPIPPRLMRYWKRANDDRLKLEVRLDAFERLRRWQAEEKRQVGNPQPTDPDYRQQLQKRVKAITVSNMPAEVRGKIIDAQAQFDLLRDDPRRHLGDYWLERIIELGTAELPSAVAKPAANGHNGSGSPPPPPPATPRNLDDVANLFDVRDLLPADIDHDHVHGIIVWGLLHPGQRGRSMFKARYMTVQFVRKDVQSKLGSNFNPDAYERALTFLERTRVVMTDHKAKRHQPVAALNPHASDGVEQGPEIIRRVLAMRDVLTQLSVS